MKTFLLAALMAAPAFAADAPQKTASKDDLELVEAVIKRDMSTLPNSVVNAFMAVDLDTIPAKLQQKAKAKRVELHTLKRLADDKKRGMLRWPEKDCSIPTEAKSEEAKVLLMAGYEEVQSDDVVCVMKRTKCSERALMCEFSLNIVIETDKKGKKKYRFFFHPRDPIMTIVQACRKNTGGNTNFFSGPTAECGDL